MEIYYSRLILLCVLYFIAIFVSDFSQKMRGILISAVIVFFVICSATHYLFE